MTTSDIGILGTRLAGDGFDQATIAQLEAIQSKLNLAVMDFSVDQPKAGAKMTYEALTQVNILLEKARRMQKIEAQT